MDKLTKKRLKQRAKEILAQQRQAETADPQAGAYAAAGRPAGINAYLLAMEALYPFDGSAPTYTYERVGGATDDPQRVMVERSHPRHVVTLAPVSDWRRELTDDLPRWAFGGSPLTPAIKLRVVETLVALLERATGDGTTCWRVHTDDTKGPMYACAESEYLFPTPGGLYLLSLQIND